MLISLLFSFVKGSHRLHFLPSVLQVRTQITPFPFVISETSSPPFGKTLPSFAKAGLYGPKATACEES
jgi:hypothetical protein